MHILPKALTDLVEELGKLPGVGPRTAERYAYYLLRAEPRIATKLAASVTNLHAGVDYCRKTFALVEKGQDLSLLSVGELSERIGILRDEIARLEAELKAKDNTKSAAEALFRRG